MEIMKKTSLLIVVLIAIVAVVGVYILTDVGSNYGKIRIEVGDEVGGTASGDGAYEIGDYVTLTAIPKYGFEFVGWYEGGQLVSNNKQYSFEVQIPRELSMKYERMSFTINLTSNYSGGIIKGGGTFTYESKVSLSASVNQGYSFDGWYEGSNRISSQTTTTYEVKSNKTVEARYNIIHDATFTIGESSNKAPTTLTLSSQYNVEVHSRTWTIKDLVLGKNIYSVSGTNNSYGTLKYNVASGKALEITQTITYKDGFKTMKVEKTIVDETVTKSFKWNYQQKAWHSLLTSWIWNNKTATWDIPLSFEEYYEYSIMARSYERSSSNFLKYLTQNDPMIRGLAEGLKRFTSEMSDIERANCVLKFVQSIPYVLDIDNKGANEYWNYPYETFWDQKGDCDDHAILFASLMKLMGYKVGMILVPGHIFVGLDVEGASGKYVMYGGTKYFYCEPTAIVGGSLINQYDVGEGSSYSSVSFYIV